jgi:hypothetical protein
MAAPQIAAAAALVMKKFPHLSPQKIVEHLCDSSDQQPNLTNKIQSGRLNLQKALSTAPTLLDTRFEIEQKENQRLLEQERKLSLDKKMKQQKETVDEKPIKKKKKSTFSKK